MAEADRHPLKLSSGGYYRFCIYIDIKYAGSQVSYDVRCNGLVGFVFQEFRRSLFEAAVRWEDADDGWWGLGQKYWIRVGLHIGTVVSQQAVLWPCGCFSGEFACFTHARSLDTLASSHSPKTSLSGWLATLLPVGVNACMNGSLFLHVSPVIGLQPHQFVLHSNAACKPKRESGQDYVWVDESWRH